MLGMDRNAIGCQAAGAIPRAEANMLPLFVSKNQQKDQYEDEAREV
jgi:hypothetical protein